MMPYYKTPFRLRAGGIGAKRYLTDKANNIIADLNTEDAEYIKLACNQYPVLLDLIKRLQCTLDPKSMYYKLCDQTMNT